MILQLYLSILLFWRVGVEMGIPFVKFYCGEKRSFDGEKLYAVEMRV